MKAIILAAGRGERLGEAAGGLPKCLLQYGGKTLLQRHIEILDELGIERIFVVTGYARDQVFESLYDLDSRAPVEVLVNLKFVWGSVVSLFHACHVLSDGADTILMDADVLYDPAILGRLFSTRAGNCLLLDRNFEPGDEPVKICVSGAAPVEFRKIPDRALSWDYQGESVGFFRFDADTSERLRQKTKEYFNNGRVHEPYEEVIRDLLRETPERFHIEDITGLDWLEIDFPEDLDRALETFRKATGQWR